MEGRVLGPVAPHLHHRQAVACQPLGHGLPEPRPIPGRHPAAAVHGHCRSEVQARGRPPVGLEKGSQLCLGQEGEDAAAVVVDQDHGEAQAVELGGQEAVQVVVEGEVAHHQRHRPRPGRGRPQGRRDQAVNAARPPVAQHPHALPAPVEGVQIPDGHAVPHHQEPVVGHQGQELREDPALEEGSLALPLTRLGQDRSGGRLQAAPELRPPRVGGAPVLEGLSPGLHQPPGLGPEDVARHLGRVPPAGRLVHHPLGRSQVPFQVEVEGLGDGGRAQPEDPARRQPLCHLRHPQEGVVGGDQGH